MDAPSSRLRWLLARLLPADDRDQVVADMDEMFDDRRRRHGARAARRWYARHAAVLVVRLHSDRWRRAIRRAAADVRHDVRLALRGIARAPGMTAVALLMLALGTGANAAVFSVIDGVMLRLPLADADAIAIVLEAPPGESPSAAVPVSHVPALAGIETAFTAVAALDTGSPVLTGAIERRRARVECVSASMFDVLGARPMLGRPFGPADDVPGSPAVVVISHRFWMTMLQGDPEVLGRTIALDDVEASVIGVMPPRFGGPFLSARVDLWAPLGQVTPTRSAYGCGPLPPDRIVNVFARVRSPLTTAAAEAYVNRAGLIAALPLPDGRTGAELRLIPFLEQSFLGVRQPLLALTGAVVCLLLIACANVAGLAIERTLRRRREWAMRLALGATRSRLVRQALVEQMVLAVLGAGAGLLLARVMMDGLVALVPSYLPHADDITLNWRVVLATLAAGLAAGVLVGVAPAWQLGRARAMRIDDVRATAAGGRWTRGLLLGVEIALGVVLLIGATLMIRTFAALSPAAPGFDPAGKTVATIRRDAGRPIDDRVFFAEVLERVRTLPGVRAAAGSTYVPMLGLRMTAEVTTNGATARPTATALTPEYFEVMRVPILQGRPFRPDDTAGTERVAIVNETLARRFWPDGGAIGARVAVTMPGRAGTRVGDAAAARAFEVVVVGVSGDTRSAGSHTRSWPEIQFPFAQLPGPYLTVFVDAAPSAGARLAADLRSAVSAVDPEQVVDRLEPLEGIVARAVSRQRFGAWLLGLFAALAVVLAAGGLAAATVWALARQTREIGVRIALGASPRQVVRHVSARNLGPAVAGVLAGLGGAALCTRLLAGWLYGVEPLDRATFIGCGAAMLVVALVASYLPARRAARIDPVAILRAEG